MIIIMVMPRVMNLLRKKEVVTITPLMIIIMVMFRVMKLLKKKIATTTVIPLMIIITVIPHVMKMLKKNKVAVIQIRDGLHIMGKVPEGETMIDMLQALTRLSNLEIASLRGAIAALFDLDASELLENQGLRVRDVPPMLVHLADRPLVTAGDIIETIDELVKHLLALLQQEKFEVSSIAKVIGATFPHLEADAETSDITTTLKFVCTGIVPNLADTTQEITNLILALDGGFVPAGPSGSPTRGMAHLEISMLAIHSHCLLWQHGK
mmetsp:Transcript_24945/g.42429  ORF Transcript_24945/g.42429 Transcript_24945/m.42429 type:complete len:266 (-) Transcript_24945:341-1138(-)